MDQVSF